MNVNVSQEKYLQQINLITPNHWQQILKELSFDFAPSPPPPPPRDAPPAL